MPGSEMCVSTKACTTCGVEKSVDDFHRDNRREDGRRYKCKECTATEDVARTYGISREEYARMVYESGGVCASCGCEDTRSGRLCVDHNHTTGEVRGLLCHHCNTALGLLKDNPKRIPQLLDYLLRGV